MGTRADFYVGRGEQAEWLGSIAFDGYPEGLPEYLKAQNSVNNWRAAVEQFLAKREDATLPDQGWPWPWANSHTTDYAYAFDEGCVWVTCFGYQWWKATDPEPECVDDLQKETVFPDMTSRQRMTLGKRSGLIIVQG